MKSTRISISLYLLITDCLCMRTVKLQAQCDPAPNIDVDWEENYDKESGNDIAYSIIEIDDGDAGTIPDDGYIVVGSTETNANQKQAWIVRLNNSGGIVWDTAYGGTLNDWAQAVEQVTDDKIVVVGIKRSSTFGSGNNDNVWLLEIDLRDGAKLSENKSGSIGHDKGYDVEINPANDYYVIAAMGGQYKTTSPGDHLYDETLNAKGVYWVLEVDPNSSYQIQWDQTFFGINTTSAEPDSWDMARSIVIDEDGNYVITGSCKSCDPDEWHDEFLTIMVDPSASYSVDTVVYGRVDHDQVGWNIIETSDGGYLTCGITHPAGMPSCLNNHNFYGVNLNSALAGAWSTGCQTNTGEEYGGDRADNAYCGVQACDGSYILVGSTKSSDQQVGCNSDGSGVTTDGWVVNISSSGVKGWDESFGSDDENDAIHCIKRLHDGSYIMAGEFGAGSADQDFYVIKFQLEDCAVPTGLSRTTSGCVATLTWDMVDCVHEYELFYKKAGEADWNVVSPATSPYPLSGYSGGSSNNYSWQVRARCSPTEVSDWVSGTPFTIPTCRLGDEVESASQVSGRLIIYPTPTDELLNVSLQIEDVSTTMARIELFETAGCLVYSSSTAIESGLLELELDVGSLPQGFYLLNVIVSGNPYRAIVVVQ